MIKAFLMTFLMAGLACLIFEGRVLDFLAAESTFYVALLLLIAVVAAAFIILGNPLKGLRHNDKDGE